MIIKSPHMRYIITISFLLTVFSSYAQPLPGKRDSIFSTVLKENRIIQVYLPQNYKPDSTSTYDVVYLLDGEKNIAFLSQIQQFAIQENFLPPFIIVGIFNTDRTRDLTVTSVKSHRRSGGAANFLSFLKTELIPYVSKTYPTKGENILHGHSFGGLFAMYAMFSEPQLFSSYIVADPSFWWDNDYSRNLAAEKLHTLAGLNKTVFITGLEEDMDDMGITVMDSVLKAKAPKDMLFKVVAYDDETHGSVKLKSVYDGLKLIYQGYRTRNESIDFHPMNGLILKDKPYTIYNYRRFPDMRFTIDGTVPVLSSAKLEYENTFTGPINLNMKSISRKGKYDKTAGGKFTLGDAPSQLKKSANLVPGGISYSYYEGQWTRVPDFRKLKPVHTGIADKDFDFSKLPSKTNFACLFEGAIEIKQQGYYTFFLSSDDGSKLFLGNKLLVDNDEVRIQRSSKSYMVPLKAGFYPIRLEYFQKGGGADVRLRYLIPGSKEPVPIPFKLQYRVSSNR